MTSMPVHIIYHPETFGLVPDALLCIIVDADIHEKVSSTEDAEPLVLASLETIIAFTPVSGRLGLV